MLLFYCTFAESLKAIARDGLVSDGEPFVLHRTLEEAQAVCRAPDGRKGYILVLDGNRIAYARVQPPTAHAIAPHAILNAKPHRPPLAIEAAGGYVVRRTKKGNLKVLVIFRRGVWDLPKGKLDRGETPAVFRSTDTYSRASAVTPSRPHTGSRWKPTRATSRRKRRKASKPWRG